MTEKTKARKIAEYVESSGRFGDLAQRNKDDAEYIDRHLDGNAASVARGVAGAARMIGTAAKAPFARRARSSEEMNELSREVAKGMKKGGKVSASSRADGCAQRGKTKGRMV